MRASHASFALALGLSTAALSCGGSPTVAHDPAGVLPPKPRVAAPERTALDVFASLPQRGSDMNVLIDTKRLRASSLYTAALVALDGTQYDHAEERFDKACKAHLFDVIGNVAFRTIESEGVLAIETKLGRDEAYACASALLGGELPELKVLNRSARAVDPNGEIVLVYDGGVLLLGSTALVERVLDSHPKPEERKRFALRDGDAARAEMGGERLPEPLEAVSARATASADELSVTVRGRVADATTAEKLKKEALATLDRERTTLQKDGAVEGVALLNSVKLDAHENEVVLTAGTKGDAIAQTKYLANVSAIVSVEMKRYVASARTAEAKNTIGAIARGIAAFAELETLKGGANRRCPDSAPAVPKTVPKGEKYQSASSDWAHPSWRAIRFELTAPQVYAYEIVTAKDKLSCKVIARGDIDGNGKQSRFELGVKIVKGHAVVDPAITEIDPLE